MNVVVRTAIDDLLNGDRAGRRNTGDELRRGFQVEYAGEQAVDCRLDTVMHFPVLVSVIARVSVR